MEYENKLRVMRIEKRLTLRELAELADVGKSTIAQIETGNEIPRVDTALMICRALGCTVEDVFRLR